MKDKKTIIINEDLQEEIIGEILVEGLVPIKELVLSVVEELKKQGIVARETDDIDTNGFRKRVKTIAIVDIDGNPLKPLEVDELVGMLDSIPRIRAMVKDDTDRRKFLKTVIEYWKNDEIKDNGLLPISYIK